jgi:hypothetical protein
MTKKAEFYAEAERLYVQEHLGHADIAQCLGLTERTIRNWDAEGSWAGRRDNYDKATGKTHHKLYKLIQHLTEKAIQSCEEGEEPSQSQLYFISKMAPLLLKLQSYEEHCTPEERNPGTAKPKQLTDDAIRHIEEEILGIRRG